MATRKTKPSRAAPDTGRAQRQRETTAAVVDAARSFLDGVAESNDGKTLLGARMLVITLSRYCEEHADTVFPCAGREWFAEIAAQFAAD